MFKLFFILSFFSFFINNAFSRDIILLKDLDNINKNIKYDNVININGGKAEIEQTIQRIYIFSNDKYYVNITYNDQFRNLSNRNRDFFKKWLDAKYISSNSIENNNLDLKRILIKNQIDIYYKELMIINEGKVYNFIVQSPIVDEMKKKLKKGDNVEIEVIYLGKNESSNLNNNFFIITDFSSKNVILNSKNILSENDFISSKKAIESEQYDFAIMKLTNFLKNNPNHMEARKSLCLAKYLNSMKLNNNKNVIGNVLSCYEDLAKIYEDGEVYYTIASIYYSNNNLKDRLKKVLNYSNFAIEFLKNEGKDLGSNRLLYCNSLYLRGLAKIELKDNDGIMDIEHAQNKCNELINVNLFSD